MNEETYGAMLERWRHTPLKHLLSEGANAERIIRTINTTDAPLTPARKAALILADEHARLLGLIEDLRIGAEQQSQSHADVLAKIRTVVG